MNKFKIITRKGDRVVDVFCALDIIEAQEKVTRDYGKRANRYKIKDCGPVELRVWAPGIAELIAG